MTWAGKRGFSVYATCGGPLFKERVVGRDNSALQNALEMNSIATTVHIVVGSRIRNDPVYENQMGKGTSIMLLVTDRFKRIIFAQSLIKKERGTYG